MAMLSAHQPIQMHTVHANMDTESSSGRKITPDNISLFNVSPLPALVGPNKNSGASAVLYSISTSGKNRRSEKILLKKKLRESAAQQNGSEFPYHNGEFKARVSFPSTIGTPRMDRTPRVSSSTYSSDQRPGTSAVNPSRRQAFLEKRKTFIQEETKRQLSLLTVTDGGGKPSRQKSSKRKTAAELPSTVAKEATAQPEIEEHPEVENVVVDLPKELQRPGALARRNTLLRTSSFSVRNANSLTREAVGIMNLRVSGRKEKKRNRVKSNQELHSDEIKLARKYVMLWMSKTAHRKRMGLMKLAPDTHDYTPFDRFKRAARLIKSLIQVCRVCQDIVHDSVSSQDWYKKIESFVDSTEMISKAQGPSKIRPFVTFVPDTKTKELQKLTFDKSMFARERRADYLMTPEIRRYLKIPSNQRTIDEENEVLMFMKSAVPVFNSYSLDKQRQIVQCMHYDKYDRDRIITRQGLPADGVYFILSGTLIEKYDDKKDLGELKPGAVFGEDDIVCGCLRRTTVVTRSEVELISVHRLDYRAIVHMADDTSDPKYLDICKQDIVFQHFPMKRLIENPGVWTLLSYKYGQLIVMDSNEMEWIYIIKSGEAKVLKHLTTGQIDLIERRRIIDKKKKMTDPHAFQRKMINFVSEKEYLKSHYKRGEYNPEEDTHYSHPKHPRAAHSAPLTSRRPHMRDKPVMRSMPGTPYIRAIRGDHSVFMSTLIREKTRFGNQLIRALPKRPTTGILSARRGEGVTPRKEGANVLKVEFAEPIQTSDDFDEEYHDDTEDANENGENHDDVDNDIKAENIDGHKEQFDQHKINDQNKNENENKKASYIDTSSISAVKLPALDKTNTKTHQLPELKKTKMIDVPKFVQLESLHAGRVFGLRSCLPPEDRGPSASLVSGGCDVLQISKKFFMKHADEALIGLIRVQNKPFPSEEDLIDRLDNNFQWEEYKQTTVGHFLFTRGRMDEDEFRNINIKLPGS